MIQSDCAARCSRRRVLMVVCTGAALVALPSARADAEDEAMALVQRLSGEAAVPSNRVRLTMPKAFPNGYTVPLEFDIDSPMTEVDHCKSVRVLAPKNPLIEVATFHFTPGRCRANASMRIRLSEPQFVVAVAEMQSGALLMAKAWVDVASDGCK